MIVKPLYNVPAIQGVLSDWCLMINLTSHQAVFLMTWLNSCSMCVFKVLPMVYQYRSRFYQWYRGNTTGTSGNANGTIGSKKVSLGNPEWSQWYNWLPMVPLGEPRMEPISCFPYLIYTSTKNVVPLFIPL